MHTTTELTYACTSTVLEYAYSRWCAYIMNVIATRVVCILASLVLSALRIVLSYSIHTTRECICILK